MIFNIDISLLNISKLLTLRGYGGSRCLAGGVENTECGGCSLGKTKVRGVPASGASDKFTPVNMDFSHFRAYFSEGGSFRLHKIVEGYFFVKKGLFREPLKMAKWGDPSNDRSA